MSHRKTVRGWLRAAPSPARPKLRAKIHPGVTGDSACPFAGLAGMGQRPTVIESVRPSCDSWEFRDQYAREAPIHG